MPRQRKYDKRPVLLVEPRQALEQLGDELRQIAESDRPAHEHQVSPEISRWAAEAIRDYLSDKNSLEHALGLRPGRGRPRKEASKEEMENGWQILYLRAQRTSWGEIATTINWQGDDSSLRQTWQRIWPDVLKEISAEFDNERFERNEQERNAEKPRAKTCRDWTGPMCPVCGKPEGMECPYDEPRDLDVPDTSSSKCPGCKYFNGPKSDDEMTGTWHKACAEYVAHVCEIDPRFAERLEERGVSTAALSHEQ